MKSNIKIEIDTVKDGQPRPYADSIYEYILTVDGMNDSETEKFCRSILYPKSQTFSEWEKGKDCASKYFAGYFVFQKLESNKYRYMCYEPYTG